MDRRRFIGTVASGLLAAPLAAETQQAAKIARIGYLNPNPNTANPRLFDAFRQRMRELGYTEARNLVIEVRSAEGNSEQLQVLAAELVTLKVDVADQVRSRLWPQSAQPVPSPLSLMALAIR